MVRRKGGRPWGRANGQGRKQVEMFRVGWGRGGDKVASRYATIER